MAYKAVWTLGSMSMFIIFELVYASKLGNFLPYHVLTLNKIEIILSVVNAWIGTIIMLANVASYNDGQDFFGLCLLVLVSPGLVVITNYYINYKWRII